MIGNLREIIVKKFRSGNVPKWMLELREEGMSIYEIGDKIAQLIKERAMVKSAAAGDEDAEVGEACWTEAAEAGEVEGVWIRGMDTKTKIRQRHGGRLFSIDEIAHVVAIDDWKKNREKIVGHIDHNRGDKKAEVDLGIEDVKYDFGNGLYFKLNPKDPEIRKGLSEGYIKPSIEIDFYSDMVKDDKILKYQPTGIGLMINGNARGGDNVGPGTPDPITSISAEGGEPMPEKKKDNEGNEGNNEPEEPENNEPEGPKNNEPEEPEIKPEGTKPEGEKNGDEDEDEVEKLRKEIEEMKKEREELLKSEKIKEDLENTIKKQIAAQIGEDYKYEDKTLDEVKRDLELINTFSKRLTDGVPGAGIVPIIPPSKPERDIDENGIPSEKWYKKVNEKFNTRKKRKEIKR